MHFNFDKYSESAPPTGVIPFTLLPAVHAIACSHRPLLNRMFCDILIFASLIGKVLSLHNLTLYLSCSE